MYPKETVGELPIRWEMPIADAIEYGLDNKRMRGREARQEEGEIALKKRFVKKKIWVLLCLFAGIVIVLLLCFGWKQRSAQADMQESAEPIRLELVYAYQNAQWNSAIEKTVADFNEKYPDIQVEYQIHYENKVYENILNTLIVRGELGDIVQLKTPEAYVENGIFTPIEKELVDKTKLTATYDYQGEVYGVGVVRATSGIIYNKEIFQTYGLQVPTTYQEFLTLCDRLQTLGITPVGVGGSDLWHMEYWTNHFFRSDVLSDNPDWFQQCLSGSVSWKDEEVTKMLEHLCQVFSNGRVDCNWRSVPDGSLAYMMSEGEVAMIYSGAWVSQEILQLDPHMELGWFYVPDETGAIQVDENQDTFWSISKSCGEEAEKYKAALTFLEYFYSSSNYSAVMDRITAFPTIEQAFSYNMDAIQLEVKQAFESNTEHITGYIGDENCPKGFESQMLDVICDMLDGKIAIANVQEKLQAIWDASLGEEAIR